MSRGETRSAQMVEGIPTGAKAHDSFFAGVADEHPPSGVDHHIARSPERVRAFCLAEVSPHLDELACSSELLDAMVPGVGDVDRAIWPDSNAPGFIESARRSRSLGDVSKPPPDIQGAAGAVEMLNAVVFGVGDIQGAVRCKGQVARTLELASFCTVHSYNVVRVQGDFLTL